MRKSHSQIPRTLVGMLPIVAALALWWLLGLSEISRLKLPRPDDVLAAFVARRGELAAYSVATFVRVVTGLLLGGIAGWMVGLAMSYKASIRRPLEPFIEILRPLPPVILIPFMILWFGLGTFSQIILIALGSFMVLLVSTFEAAGAVPARYVLTAQSLGASRRSAFLSTVIPAIRPHLTGPVRVAAGTAFGVTVAAEYLGAQGGLGYLVRNARVTLNTDVVALASILLGLEAVVLDRLLRWYWRSRTRWAESAAEEPPIDLERLSLKEIGE